MSQGVKDGFNLVTFKDGGSYEGMWKDGLPSGEGKSRDPSGNLYAGEFHKGIPHGRGTHQHVNGEHYVGAFANGRKNGFGVWTHPSGDQYAGEFQNDMRHGMGTYSTASGQTWTGEWRSGKQYKKVDSYADGETIRRMAAALQKIGSPTVDVGYGEFSGTTGQPILDPRVSKLGADLGKLNMGSAQQRSQGQPQSGRPGGASYLIPTNPPTPSSDGYDSVTSMSVSMQAGQPPRPVHGKPGHMSVQPPPPGYDSVGSSSQPMYDEMTPASPSNTMSNKPPAGYDAVMSSGPGVRPVVSPGYDAVGSGPRGTPVAQLSQGYDAVGPSGSQLSTTNPFWQPPSDGYDAVVSNPRRSTNPLAGQQPSPGYDAVISGASRGARPPVALPPQGYDAVGNAAVGVQSQPYYDAVMGSSDDYDQVGSRTGTLSSAEYDLAGQSGGRYDSVAPPSLPPKRIGSMSSNSSSSATNTSQQQQRQGFAANVEQPTYDLAMTGTLPPRPPRK